MGRLNLRSRLALLVVAGVLPLIAFNLGTAYVGYRQDRARAEQQAMDLARGIGFAVQGEIKARIAALEVLAQSNALAADDYAAFRIEAGSVVARQAPGSNILLLREDGQQLMNTALPPDAPLPVRQNLDNQRRVSATQRPSVSDVYFGVVVRRPIIAIEVPVSRTANRDGLVLAMNPTLDAFDGILRSHVGGSNWTIGMLDRAGVRVARIPDPERYVGQPVVRDFLRVWLTGRESGIVEAISPEGQPVVTAFSRLPESGWGVVVAIPTADLTGPAWKAAALSFAVGLVLLLLGLILARQIARGVLRPVLALLRLAAVPDNLEGVQADVDLAAELPEAGRLAEAQIAEARRRYAATQELVESERRLRLVVAELNHRAKNALSTVQSLAMQTARSEARSDPTRFAHAFSARVQTLARIHDVLTEYAWEGAPLEPVLRAALAPWLESKEDAAQLRLALHCPHDFSVPMAGPGQVKALAMAFHELAVNAEKHGALSGGTGRVEVHCKRNPETHESTIEWHEIDGPPLVGPAVRRGFGIRFLENGLVRDLGSGANVSLDFNRAGLRAVIRFVPQLNPAERRIVEALT